MELLLRRDLHEVWFAHLRPPLLFSSPITGTAFSLLLFQGDDRISSDERWHVAQAIVQQGCRFAVCAGHECSLWDDSIDMVSVMAKLEDGLDLPHIQTSWHDHDSLPQVVDFFIRHTQWNDWANARYVVVVLGGDDATAANVRNAVMAGFEEAES